MMNADMFTPMRNQVKVTRYLILRSLENLLSLNVIEIEDYTYLFYQN